VTTHSAIFQKQSGSTDAKAARYLKTIRRGDGKFSSIREIREQALHRGLQCFTGFLPNGVNPYRLQGVEDNSVGEG
jgi:hypothetical protein